ncbi:MAG: DNRLRE domain-containing protein, partial [Thermoanaerobaculia bacterium]
MRRTLPCLSLAFALCAGSLAADTVTIAPAADTTIFEENADASDAKGPGLFVGRNNQTFIRRAFVRFDVAAAVPPGSTINGARLDLVLTRANGNPVDVSLFAASAGWGEGTSDSGIPGGSGAAATPGDATWTRRVYPGTAWTNPGGDTAAARSAISPIAATLTTYSFGPVAGTASDVQRWLDDPATNYGWQLRADELQAAPSARRFGSRESANAFERPSLTIIFTPPGGGGGGGPRAADDVPALSRGAVLG